jgi:tRNA A37 threonylcarbamoyltransferase TsaD
MTPVRSAGGGRRPGRSVELAICDTLVDRTANALAWFRGIYPAGASLVAAGGVAANRRCASASPGWRKRPGSRLSRRRRNCAPTTAR